jgi:hypothetical protein
VGEQHGSEPQGSVRTNISLPRELKDRMDKVSARVNWSAVAAEAFRRKLLELESVKKGAQTMDELVARLREADELDRNETYQDGWKAGEYWAKRRARPRQLRRLDRIVRGDPEGVKDKLASFASPDEQGIRILLHQCIDGGDPSQAEARDFWELVLGDGDAMSAIDDEDFACGFVEGALDVWDKVVGHL